MPVLLAAALPWPCPLSPGSRKRPRSGLALTQRTRLRSSCSEEDRPVGRLRLTLDQPGSASHEQRTEQTLPATALAGIPSGVGEVGLNGEFDRLVRHGSTKRGGYRFGDIGK